MKTGPKRKWLLPEENVVFSFFNPLLLSRLQEGANKSHEREPVPKIASLFILDSIYIYI